MHHLIPFAATTLAAGIALAGCQRTDAPGADSVGLAASTVRAVPAEAAASGPLPVAPAGLTNSSTAAQSADLSDRKSATSASGSVTSTTRGTSPMPNDGTLPSETSSGGAKP